MLGNQTINTGHKKVQGRSPRSNIEAAAAGMKEMAFQEKAEAYEKALSRRELRAI